MPLVIVISGLSGSGKSTLGKKLNKLKNVNVIELDDIDDENALILLKKQWMGVDKFNKMKDKMNSISIMNIINNIKDNDIYIFVGLLDEINKFATHKYFIKPDIVKIYKQVNLRTLGDIVNSENAMKKLFNKCKTLADIEKTNEIILYKYKIRRLFPDSKYGIKDMIDRKIDDAKKNDFKILHIDKIYNVVKNHINNMSKNM
jgi:adenylate kinase family enzyme